MELIEGQPLNKILMDGTLSEDQFVNLATQLLDAMRVAHTGDSVQVTFNG
jgi:hypothetical protein